MFDDSALGRFKTPPMGCDLGEGYERVTWRKEGWEGGGVREGVDGLVECIRRVERDKGKILAKGKEGEQDATRMATLILISISF